MSTSTIDYELALALKKAGFPQKINPEAPPWFNKFMEETVINTPTLSELIEACGDCLSHIKKWNGYWWAVSHCGHEEHEIGGNNLEIMASTPEEAVAKLWLELNKNVIIK